VAGVADTASGSDGTVNASGVTVLDAVEIPTVPIELSAWTLNVYSLPGFSPEMVVLVTGGVPTTVVAVCAADPM